MTDLTPVRQRTLGDEVADRLRDAIRSGSLTTGQRLVERELAEQLGVSRVPVREAIQRLAEEGLVRKSPHRGTFVYVPTQTDVEEISSLRVVLERFVIERAIARWSPEHEARLRQIIDAMRRAAEAGDMHDLYEQDFLLHSVLWEIAEHDLLLEVVSSLRSRINHFLQEATGVLPASELEMHISSHDILIDTIASGDVALAQAEIERHVMGAKTRILTYYSLPESQQP